MSSCTKPPACAGDLRVPFNIQAATTADDGAGGQTTTWAQTGTGWASVHSQGGPGETLDRDRLVPMRYMVVWARYGLPITEANRLEFEDGICRIRLVEDWQRRKQWLRIEVEQGPPVNG